MEETGLLPVFRAISFLIMLIILCSSVSHAYKPSPAPSGTSSFKWDKDVLLVDCDPRIQEEIISLNQQNLELLGNCLVPEIECSTGTNLDASIYQLEDWSYGPQVLAITKNRYDLKLGLIVFSKIELNASKLDRYPIDNTLNHELGHLLGLEHSKDPEATMHEIALPGELKKASLNSDDIEALCYLYSLESAQVDLSSKNCGSQTSLSGAQERTYDFYCDSVELKDDPGGCMLRPKRTLNSWSILFYLNLCLMVIAIRFRFSGDYK